MVVACAVSASINEFTLPFPPESVRLVEPEDEEFDSLGGYPTYRKRNGRLAEWIWGERAVTAEVIQWLRNVLELAEPAAIAWEEPDGSSYAFPALCEFEESEWLWTEGGFYQPFRLVFYETVPEV